MDSPERLAADQRAVLALVLGQGRSYGEIADTLSIAPDEVRARALAALESLGPATPVPDAGRARIADYLLGQLPASDEPPVRDALADSPQQRAWARVVSTELGPLASRPLPSIPDRAATPVPTPVPRDDIAAESLAGPGNGQPPGAADPTAPRSSRTGGSRRMSVPAVV